MDMSTAKKKKKKKSQTEESEDLMFINAEDELLCQVSKNIFCLKQSWFRNSPESE